MCSIQNKIYKLQGCNMIVNVSKSKTFINISKCKGKFDGRKCNSNQENAIQDLATINAGVSAKILKIVFWKLATCTCLQKW